MCQGGDKIKVMRIKNFHDSPVASYPYMVCAPPHGVWAHIPQDERCVTRLGQPFWTHLCPLSNVESTGTALHIFPQLFLGSRIQMVLPAGELSLSKVQWAISGRSFACYNWWKRFYWNLLAEPRDADKHQCIKCFQCRTWKP